MIYERKIPFGNLASFWADFGEKMNAIKTCTQSKTEGCWHAYNSFYNINNYLQIEDTDEYGMITLDGTMVSILTAPGPNANGYIVKEGGWTGNYLLYTDLNGKHAPNLFGYDIFQFEMHAENVIPSEHPDSVMYLGENLDFSNYCTVGYGGQCEQFGTICAMKVLANEDYIN